MILKRIVKLTVEQVADCLEMWAREYSGIDFEYSDFYCGIGKDMDERAQWHKTDCIRYVKTDSRDSAGEVEKEMNRRGFDTGDKPDNGGDEESIYVYIYPITQYTQQTAE